MRRHQIHTICIQISTSQSLLTSLQFHLIISLNLQHHSVLSPNRSYPCPQPLYMFSFVLFPPTPKYHIFSPNHHYPFLIFLTAVFIRRNFLTKLSYLLPYTSHAIALTQIFLDIPKHTSSELVIPLSRLVTVGDRSFAVAGPRLWNTLPEDITSAPALHYIT